MRRARCSRCADVPRWPPYRILRPPSGRRNRRNRTKIEMTSYEFADSRRLPGADISGAPAIPSSVSGLAFDAGTGNAFDDLPLGKGEEDKYRNGGDDRAGHDDGKVG
jgi:hypothetical protein